MFQEHFVFNVQMLLLFRSVILFQPTVLNPGYSKNVPKSEKKWEKLWQIKSSLSEIVEKQM